MLLFRLFLTLLALNAGATYAITYLTPEGTGSSSPSDAMDIGTFSEMIKDAWMLRHAGRLQEEIQLLQQLCGAGHIRWAEAFGYHRLSEIERELKLQPGSLQLPLY